MLQSSKIERRYVISKNGSVITLSGFHCITMRRM
jgi:hypothetical protein